MCPHAFKTVFYCSVSVFSHMYAGVQLVCNSCMHLDLKFVLSACDHDI